MCHKFSKSAAKNTNILETVGLFYNWVNYD